MKFGQKCVSNILIYFIRLSNIIFEKTRFSFARKLSYNAMKTLFIKSVAHNSTEEEKALSYQFMKICEKLDSGSLLILKAAFDIKTGKISKKLSTVKIDTDSKSVQPWLRNISIQIGHGIKSLVEIHEDELVDLKLISPRTHNDRSGIENMKNYRLTDLGVNVCEYIHNQIA